jgi:choline dehydrogenase-like flavoprotein
MSLTVASLATGGAGFREPAPLRQTLSNWIRHRCRGDALAIQIEHEQPGGRDDRIELTIDVDAFGRPNVRPRMAGTGTENPGVDGLVDAVRGEFARLGLGTVRPFSDWIELSLRTPLTHIQADDWQERVSGTTRMASLSSQGVVNSRGAVFDVDSLWIAGASVLPCGGGRTALLSILALSNRTATDVSRYLKTSLRPICTKPERTEDARDAVNA